jgi:Zn-dependent protease
MATIAMLAFFGSLILHELAHAIVARRSGVEIEGITLFIFGGVAEMASEPKTASSEFWIAVVGPLMSLGLAGGFWMLAILGHAFGVPPPAADVLIYLAIVNAILALFNLLPAFPLDGGRVFRAFLWNRSGNLLEATRTASGVGATISYVLVGLGLFSLFAGNLMGGLWQALIGLFLLFASRSAYASQLMKSYLSDKSAAMMMTQDPVTVTPERSLSDLVDRVMLPNRTSFVPVVEDGVLLGFIDNSVLVKIDRDNWATTQVGDVFYEVDDSNTIAGNLRADEVLKRMTHSGRRKFLVAEAGRLLGVLTLSDLMRYIALLQELRWDGRGASMT